jgi:PQQ-dependent dehydrogenase (methanol/ethanol family)
MGGYLAISFALLLLSIGVVSCGDDRDDEARTGYVTDTELDRAAADPSVWLTHGGDYSEDRYSELDLIDLSNVSRLGLAWTFDTGLRGGHEATPLVADGVMYLTGPWSTVYALDARTGDLLWRHDPQVPRLRGLLACCDVVNRGVALYEGLVYVGTLDGRLVALDVASGSPVWETLTVDQDKAYTITGAPRVINGLVVIGNGGAELGVRGYVSAYDARSGELVWRTYTVPGDPALGFESEAMELAAATWSGEWWALGGGGTAWDGMAFDPDRDLLYVGTGNGSPWNARIRSPEGGDNLFLSSILALRASDGGIVWHYQTTPGDHWDFTATQPLILATLEIDGTERDVLMQAPKNGFFYVLDRESGELISAEEYVPVTWADGVDPETGRPVENPAARYGDTPERVEPGAYGGHNWQPMSFSPRTGLVYIPIHEFALTYAENAETGVYPGVWNTRADIAGASVPQGFLLAWDPITQSERWRVAHEGWWNGGVLSTSGGLVFQGAADGRFAAYHEATGELAWEVSTGLGIIAPPVSYMIDDVQYVTVVAGWGGAAGRSSPPVGDAVNHVQRGRVLTFVLDGERPMPALEPARTEIVVADAAVPMDPESIAAGRGLFGLNCAMCHGVDGGPGGAMPDLLTAPQEVHDAFLAIVLEGAREPLGMPAFRDRLSSAEAQSIHAYLIESARRAGGG